MTREEAIEELIEFKDKSWDGMSEEVIDMAIKALSQESCEKSMNKKYTFGKNRGVGVYWNEQTDTVELPEAVFRYILSLVPTEEIEQEPCESIHGNTYGGVSWGGTYKPQEPCDECRNKRTSFCGNCKEYDEFEPCDAISRKPNCIDCIHKSVCFRLDMRVDSDYAEKCGDFLTELPTVTQKPNFCASCKHNTDNEICLECEYDGITRGMTSYEPVTQKSGKWIDGVHAMGYREGYKDAQKQKLGHWIHFAQSDECSECGWNTGKYISPSKYCPNCGTEMKG